MEDHIQTQDMAHRPDMVTVDSSGTDVTNSSDDYDVDTETETDMDGNALQINGHTNGRPRLMPGDSSYDDRDLSSYPPLSAVSSATSVDGITPMTPASSYGWGSQQNTISGPPPPNAAALRSRGSGANSEHHQHPSPPHLITNGLHNSRPPVGAPRPSAIRQASNAYNPARRPHQYSFNTTQARARNGSSNRTKRNPNAEYRAQEKAYVQRIRQDAQPEGEFFNELRTPGLDYSDDTEDEESPSTNEYAENDPYDQETLLWYGNDDMQPSVEELKIPENRERLEWHSMLANVLTGDVVKQEKKRLIGGTEQQGDNSLWTEVWVGIRARVCGRSITAQRRMIDDGRGKLKKGIEDVIAFEIKGEIEVGKPPLEQVRDVVKSIEKMEGLYPTRQAFEAANARGASLPYKGSCDAVISWHNTTELINTELGILQAWVGNNELEFTKPRTRPPSEQNSGILDDSSFIDRILKEDGLKSLFDEEKSKKEGGKPNGLFYVINTVIDKAKATLIANAEAFADRHLPPYIEELLTLINFPSRLVQEIIKVRLGYAKRMRDPDQKGVMMAEQMIIQFQILLKLAVRVKEAYLLAAQPEPGWDLPPCIDEAFDRIVLDAVRFYFKMLNWKLSANKNTFKEAEILEQEWGFCNELGRHLEGGDIEVAEQFR